MPESAAQNEVQGKLGLTRPGKTEFFTSYFSTLLLFHRKLIHPLEIPKPRRPSREISPHRVTCPYPTHEYISPCSLCLTLIFSSHSTTFNWEFGEQKVTKKTNYGNFGLGNWCQNVVGEKSVIHFDPMTVWCLVSI